MYLIDSFVNCAEKKVTNFAKIPQFSIREITSVNANYSLPETNGCRAHDF